jgi:hypothetical protein
MLALPPITSAKLRGWARDDTAAVETAAATNSLRVMLPFFLMCLPFYNALL